MTPRPPTPRWFRPTLVALFAAGLALSARVFLPGEPLGDDLSIHFSEIHVLADALRHGRFGFWNPDANLGFPSAYYYQAFPQLSVALLHLATFGALSLLWSFKLVLALCIALPPVTTAWALHRAGRPADEALGAGVALVFVGGRSRWGYGTDSLFWTGIFTQTFAFLFFGPAVVAADRFIAEGKDRARAFAWSLATGLAHPFLGVVLGAFTLVRFWDRKALPRQLARAATLAALLVIGTAGLWLPIFVDYDSFGGFPARVAFEEGIPPRLFIPTFVRGELLDLGRMMPLVTVLAVLGLAFPTARRYALLGSVGALAIMAGPFLGKTKDDLFPMIRFLAPMEWAWAVSAGITTVELARRARTYFHKRPTWQSRAVVVAVGAIALWEGIPRLRTLAGRPQVASDAPGVARDELAALEPALQKLPRARTQVAGKLGTGNHFWGYLPSVYAAQPSLISWGGAALQSSPNFVYLREELDWVTNAALYDAPYLLLSKAKRSLAPTVGDIAAESRGFAILRLPAPGLVSGVSILGTLPADRFERRKATSLWLHSPNALAGAHYEHPGSQLAHNAAVVKLTSSEESPSRYRLRLVVEKRGTAAIRISYHPRWQATLDGRPIYLGRLSPDILGIEFLDEGEHTLELRFTRPWWHAALYALMLGLLALLFALDARANRQAS